MFTFVLCFFKDLLKSLIKNFKQNVFFITDGTKLKAENSKPSKEMFL